jgi:hypothetical protein
MLHGLDYLEGCQSKPKTLGDLKAGDKFIFFPMDGDDSGHGGFRSGTRLFVKIEPYWPGEPYHESYRFTCKEYERPAIVASWPLNLPVIQIHGIN